MGLSWAQISKRIDARVISLVKFNRWPSSSSEIPAPIAATMERFIDALAGFADPEDERWRSSSGERPSSGITERADVSRVLREYFEAQLRALHDAEIAFGEGTSSLPEDEPGIAIEAGPLLPDEARVASADGTVRRPEADAPATPPAPSLRAVTSQATSSMPSSLLSWSAVRSRVLAAIRREVTVDRWLDPAAPMPREVADSIEEYVLSLAAAADPRDAKWLSPGASSAPASNIERAIRNMFGRQVHAYRRSLVQYAPTPDTTQTFAGEVVSPPRVEIRHDPVAPVKSDLPESTAAALPANMVTQSPNSLRSPTPKDIAGSVRRPSPTPSSERGARLRDKWFAADNIVAIAGIKIRAGLIYVSSATEGALYPESLDRALTVADVEEEGEHGVVDAYAKLSDVGRASYLHWLAGSRRAPQAAIAYPLLYLAGLERRVVEIAISDSRSELRIIGEEVRQLQSVYGYADQFWVAAEQVRVFISLLFDNTVQPEVSISDGPRSSDDHAEWETLETRIDIARHAASGRAIPAGLARAWLARTSADSDQLRRKSNASFGPTFERIYRQAHPEGLVVHPRRLANIRFVYEPTNANLSRLSCVLGLQDAYRSAAGLAEIHRIAASTDDALGIDGISAAASMEEESVDGPRVERGVADDLPVAGELVAGGEERRTPVERRSERGAVGLPLELDVASGSIEEDQSDDSALPAIVEQYLGDSSLAWVDVQDLLAEWRQRDGFIPAWTHDTTHIANYLAEAGLGVAPDSRVDKELFVDNRVGVFRLANPKVEAGAEYRAAALVVELAAAVSRADGVVAEEERALLETHVDTAFTLTADESIRLRALSQWLLTDDGSDAALAVVRGHLKSEGQDLEAIGVLVVGMAEADGVVLPQEREMVERIHSFLGLAPPAFTLVDADTPAEPSVGEPQPIVPEPSGQQSFPASDAAESMAARLIDIWGDVVDPTLELAWATADDDAVGEFDATHYDLLRTLSKRGRWSASEFEDLCRQSNLMPNGAVENLNEYADVTVGERVVLPNDSWIDVDLEVAGELLA